MTSIQLFRQADNLNKSEPKEWGTGDFKEQVKAKVWVPTKPTWQYSGEPIDQFYSLTQLKLSNVRSNDQLLPDPKECDMGRILINKPFPAEHSYSSHISRNAVIPKFDSPEDPKRGVLARNQQPINNEMPARPFDVTVVTKTKGHGHRQEIIHVPKESEKKAMVWHGEDGFTQLVNLHGGHESIYPYPTKLVVPNLEDRPSDMKISQRTANTLRNIEREQWQTSYDLAHTGLGSVNTLNLDNYEEKVYTMATYGIEDDNLYPRSLNTYDPPRPVEGRIAKRISQPPAPQTTETEEETDYQRNLTLNEVEEHRLLNGKEYINLPEMEREEERWRTINDAIHHEPQLETLRSAQLQAQESDVPNQPTGPPPTSRGTYLDTMKDEQNNQFQQVEAQNRWKLLESQKPANDIELLNVKYQHLNDGERPDTFYKHERCYNEERAGLYQTSYDPYRLYHSMDGQQTSGPEIMNTLSSHVDALNLSTQLDSDMEDALRNSKTDIPLKTSGRLSPREVLTPHMERRLAQKEWLQPSVKTSSVKTQEGGTIVRESTKCDDFDVDKFLQECELPKYARNDPLHLMSSENQNLGNVRIVSSLKPTTKSVRFSDKVAVSMDDSLLSRTRNQTEGSYDNNNNNRIPNTIEYISRQAQWKRENEFHGSKAITPVAGITDALRREQTMPELSAVVRFRPKSGRRATSSGLANQRNDFASLSTNFTPGNLKHSIPIDTAYQNQFPAFNIDFKHDAHFQWEPGCGTPRPQTDLLQIQDSFKKSDIHRKFHSSFPEDNPDLRHSIFKGKKHIFDGVNCQVLHG